MGAQKTDCTIELHNKTNNIYFAGEKLTGSVNLQFYTEKVVTAIFLKIRGVARTEWYEHYGHSSQVFIGCQKLISMKEFYHGYTNGQPVTVPPGTYNYNFDHDLSEDLPATFDGIFGNISYSVSLIIDRPLRKRKSYITKFVVFRNFNLTDDLSVQQPFNIGKNFNFLRFFIVKSNDLRVTVDLPKTGFVSGEIIPILLSVDNKSSKTVTGFKVTLFKIITYYDNSRKNKTKSKIKISSVLVDGCPVRKFVNLNVQLIVPDTPPSESKCNILTIMYKVTIIGQVDGIHFNPEIKVPILIGTKHFDDRIAAVYTRPVHFEIHDLPSYNDVFGESSKNG